MVRVFSLRDMKSATNKFSETLVIGEGGFGKVYKGSIDKGSTTVAIKRLKAQSSQGREEFLAEMLALSNLQHPHIVNLLGYCMHGKTMLLVYEFMSNGSLNHLLHSRKGGVGTSPLSWEQRLSICIGVARGLAYLHGETGSNLRIIHRDVKTSNILLDEHWVPKITDFGLSKNIFDGSYISTNVKGTIGYLDPEYLYTGHLSTKSDVFSFGVVMLELLCGRPALDMRFREEEPNLAPWALQHINNEELDVIVDPTLRKQISFDCLKCFVQVALQSLSRSPSERPSMTQVLSSLEQALMFQRQGIIAESLRGISGIPSLDGSDHWNISVSKSTIHSQVTQAKLLAEPSGPVRYYFDESIEIGQSGSSKLHSFFIPRPTNEARRMHGKETQGVKISEGQWTTPQQRAWQRWVKGKLAKGLHQQTNQENGPFKFTSLTGIFTCIGRKQEGNEIDAVNDNASTEVLEGPASTVWAPCLKNDSDEAKPSAGKSKATDHSDVKVTETIAINKELVGAEQPSEMSKIEIVVSNEKVVADAEAKASITAFNKNPHKKSTSHEFEIVGTQDKDLSPAKAPQERLEDKYDSRASSLTSSLELERDDKRIVYLEPERDERGIVINRSIDGMITLSDQSGEEVRLHLEALSGITENTRQKLLQIIKLRPDTFMQIGKLSPFFVKLIMEAFGGLIEFLECTVLNKSSPKAFDEILHMLEDLKRNMLKVDWLEERVRAMSAQVKFDSVSSELKLTTVKISECELQLAELKDKKKKLEIEARHLEKRPHVDFDMDGNAAQALF